MSAIGEPRTARSRRTRQALLDQARELIETEGFASLTMAAVADRAGVSHRAVYLHFASRGELLGTLVRSFGETERLAESLAAVWAAPDAETALTEWARHIGRAHPRILAVARALEHDRRTDADAAEVWQRIMSGWSAGSRRLADWLDREGRLAPPWTPQLAADMIWALMSWDFLERLTVDREWSSGQFGDYFALLVARTFLDDGPASGSAAPGSADAAPAC
ncbi:TetR/AcrR family transcriptional regulator [Plantactinospora sp. GCM10030261]|uniref:TetR/AcrR family transcriptional regulator n=1 Tax=Plantactinospora sp. GCM10030261 TaxID=3273420 RepID=UPI00360E6217